MTEAAKKIPIVDQVAAVERARKNFASSAEYLVAKAKIEQRDADAEIARLTAAIATLKFVDKHAAAIRAIARQG